jgi:phosphatidylinositol kinase/protein kinase (PI-3  family)
VEAYNVLRKNANLFLNLLQLMADANIDDIGHERNILQVQERFQLEKGDEEAGQSFQRLMQESISALFPRISEKIHKWKQYWDTH